MRHKNTEGELNDNNGQEDSATASMVEIAAAEIAEKGGTTMERAGENDGNEMDPIMSSGTTTTTIKGSSSSGSEIFGNDSNNSFLQSKGMVGSSTMKNIIPPPSPFVGGTKKMDGIFTKNAKSHVPSSKVGDVAVIKGIGMKSTTTITSKTMSITDGPLPLKGNSFPESLSKRTQVPKDGSESGSDSIIQRPPPLKGTQISSGMTNNNVGTGLPFTKKSIGGEMNSPFTPPPPLKGMQVSPGAATNNVGTGLPFVKKSIGEMKSLSSTTPPSIPSLNTPQLNGKDSLSGAKVGSGLPFKQKSIDEMNTIMTPDSISSNSDTTRKDVVTINDRTDAETFLRRQTVESDKMIGRGHRLIQQYLSLHLR